VQQVGMIAMGVVGQACTAKTAPDRLPAPPLHLTPQAQDAFGICSRTVFAQPLHQPPHSIARVDQIDPVYEAHNTGAVEILLLGLVSKTGAAHPQQDALGSLTQFGMIFSTNSARFHLIGRAVFTFLSRNPI
jgi:hypothetical protein